MANVIVILIIVLAVILSIRLSIKLRKKGDKCIGCPYSGTCNDVCKK